MSAAQITFTKKEYEAFNALFDAVRCVMGSSNEHRIADPVGKLGHVFRVQDEASAFVRRLMGLGLMEVLFRRIDGGEESRETYRVSIERWVDLASRVVQLPDEPLRDEEELIEEAIARAMGRLDELSSLREALAVRMREAENDIAVLTKELEELRTLGGDLRQVRERVRKAVLR